MITPHGKYRQKLAVLKTRIEVAHALGLTTLNASAFAKLVPRPEGRGTFTSAHLWLGRMPDTPYLSLRSAAILDAARAVAEKEGIPTLSELGAKIAELSKSEEG